MDFLITRDVSNSWMVMAARLPSISLERLSANLVTVMRNLSLTALAACAALILSPLGAASAADLGLEPTLASIRIVSGKTVNLNPDAPGDHRHLKVQATMVGSADPDPQVTVTMAQYRVRTGDKVSTPRVILNPLVLHLSRTSGDVSTYTGVVTFADLQVGGARIPYGRRAAVCIDSVVATTGSVVLPLSARAQNEVGGAQCVRLVQRKGAAQVTNALYTGFLTDVTVTKGPGSSRYLNFSADKLAFFNDRPVRTTRTLPFENFAGKSAWRKTFDMAAPLVELAVDETTRHVPVRMGAPKSVADSSYRAKIRFATSTRLKTADVNGRDVALFASSTPIVQPDQETCEQQSRALAEGHVPGGSDFVGSLSNATVTAVPGEAHLTLASTDPLFFNWYRGTGYGCQAHRTGATDFAGLADPAHWAALFGRINPNSAILWESGAGAQILEFEQEIPKYDQETDTWVSVIRPIFGKSVPSQRSVDRFIKKFGTSLEIGSSYLYMDATGSATYGGGVTVVDENFSIGYHVLDGETLTLQFTLVNGADGWMGVCFHEFMFPADCVIAWMDDGETYAWDAYNPGIPTLVNFPAPLQDTDPVLVIDPPNGLNNRDNLTGVVGTDSSGEIIVTMQRPMFTGDIFDFEFDSAGLINVIAAYSSTEVFTNADNAQQPMHTAAIGATWALD